MAGVLIEGKTVWFQKELALQARNKGCHLLDDEVLAKLPEISSLKVGTAHFFSEYTITILHMVCLIFMLHWVKLVIVLTFKLWQVTKLVQLGSTSSLLWCILLSTIRLFYFFNMGWIGNGLFCCSNSDWSIGIVFGGLTLSIIFLYFVLEVLYLLAFMIAYRQISSFG